MGRVNALGARLGAPDAKGGVNSMNSSESNCLLGIPQHDALMLLDVI